MAKFTEEQCDASDITREKLKNGSWFIRVTNEDGEYCDHPDTVSEPDASLETSKVNAHTYLMEECEYEEATEDNSTKPEILQ